MLDHYFDTQGPAGQSSIDVFQGTPPAEPEPPAYLTAQPEQQPQPQPEQQVAPQPEYNPLDFFTATPFVLKDDPRYKNDGDVWYQAFARSYGDSNRFSNLEQYIDFAMQLPGAHGGTQAYIQETLMKHMPRKLKAEMQKREQDIQQDAELEKRASMLEKMNSDPRFSEWDFDPKTGTPIRRKLSRPQEKELETQRVNRRMQSLAEQGYVIFDEGTAFDPKPVAVSPSELESYMLDNEGARLYNEIEQRDINAPKPNFHVTSNMMKLKDKEGRTYTVPMREIRKRGLPAGYDVVDSGTKGR